MLKTYTYPKFDYVRPPELVEQHSGHYPVVIVGAGPVGLSMAIDLAAQGQKVLLLDNDDTVSIGSRGVCYAKRALEVLDRMGCGSPCVDKGVSWNVGRTFFGEGEVFNFNLRPQDGHNRPGMVNLQQYYLEDYLVQRARQLPNLEMRFKNNVISVEQDDKQATVRVETPDGAYTLTTDWLVAADGARSPIRNMLGLEIDGKIFMDRFLIADVIMKADYPAERWFWFDPPFHPNQSVLLHKQADNVWRIDFQLGWDADPDEERKPERILPRVQALLRQGFKREVPFTLEWASIYTFACLRMDRFRHGRVIFAGDSAHGVSPFGARGANSGVQDAENLAWKLDAVLRGQAPDALLDSYSSEREYAADENILNSTRATDFITPKSEASRIFRDAVLGLAREYEFARRIVNSGRLSVPATLDGSTLNTADSDGFTALTRPGAVAADAPMTRDGRKVWLLRELGEGFTLLVFGPAPTWAADLGVQVLEVGAQGLQDSEGLAAQRYDARPGTSYLIRPDHHVAARWRAPTAAAVRAAIAHALAKA